MRLGIKVVFCSWDGLSAGLLVLEGFHLENGLLLTRVDLRPSAFDM